MSPTNPLLQVTNLGKRFGGLTVAAGLEFTLIPGEIHCIIGPNGAGKTTFFNILTGFVRPDAGEIRFADVAITHLTPDRRVRLGMARSFQQPQLFLLTTVWENVRLAAQRSAESLHPLRRMTDEHGIKNAATTALEQVWLLPQAERLACHLSHGEQKRLDIAMALATRPRLLLLDEPTAGMTGGETAEMAALIRSLAPALTVLFIEHDMEFVRDTADRVTVFHRGEILAAGSVAAVERDPRVQEIYLGSGLET